jgi:hypothetical protein
MGLVLPPFPDAEAVVMALLEHLAPTVTATPADLQPPLIRVQRVGGSDDHVTDRPRVEIACYGTNRTQAWGLAEACRTVILASPRTTVAGVLVDTARTDNPPTQVPYATSEDTRRVVAYYRLAWRRAPQPRTVHKGDLICDHADDV